MNTNLSIVTLSPDLANLRMSVLRQEAAPINFKSFDKNLLRKIIQELFRVMYLQGGVGLAAPQVGIPLQIFIADTSRGREVIPMVFINPKITFYSDEKVEDREGCLSIPGYAGLVNRSKSIALSYWNQLYKPEEIEIEDYLARVIQHEYDHLSGVLYIDHVKNKKKLFKIDPDTLSKKAMRKLQADKM